MTKFSLCCILLSSIACGGFSVQAKVVANGRSEGHSYVLKQMAQLPGPIWAFDWLDDDVLLLTLRNHGVYKLQIKLGQFKALKSPNFHQQGQGGMLDLRVLVFDQQKWVYVTYAGFANGQANTRLARARVLKNKLGAWEEVFNSNAYSSSGVHFGSRLVMDSKGFLFMSLGDRGNRDNAQALSSHAGSILRLNTSGKAPKDNPFVNTKGAQAEIWSYGHRNPQGLAFDSLGQLWAIEHGPRGGDELNLISRASNYGWPVISYGKEYHVDRKVGEGTHRKGMKQPKKIYVPSIAPCGMSFYYGKAFPKWQGHLFVGALAKTHVNQLVIKNNAVVNELRLFKKLRERIRDVRVGPRGYIWLATDSGTLLSIMPEP